MSRLRDIITDTLVEFGIALSTEDEDLAQQIERAIVDSAGGADHLINVKGAAWTIQHPVTERFEDPAHSLFNCRFTTLVMAGIPALRREGSGQYRLWLDRNALMWERVRD